MTESLDVVVVGGGVIGLAVGRALADTHREVVVLEAENAIGTHASSRNSEVIHAGIYYPEQSLKARLCVQGKQRLYAYCDERGLPHQRIGKLIVATESSQLDRLSRLQQQGQRNGVDDLRVIGPNEARGLEPAVDCIAALVSPSTGIFDSHSYMISLQGDLESAGGAVLVDSRVSGIKILDGGFRFEVDRDRFECRTLVNAAGLDAVDLAASISEGNGARRKAFQSQPSQPDAAPSSQYAKGHYFTYPGKSPFNHLVYPLPMEGGLGIHATNDLAGAVRFGPDVTWVDKIDYTFDESRRADFVKAIRTYYPSLDGDKLSPGYTGIRAKLHGSGEPAADFVIATDRDHGIPGLVNLLGIESPGLTASLAIADYVRDRL